MLTRFTLRQSCPAIAGHRRIHDFSQRFWIVHHPRQTARRRRCRKPPAASYCNQFGRRAGVQAEQLIDGLGGRGRVVLFVTRQLALGHVLNNALPRLTAGICRQRFRAGNRTWQNGMHAVLPTRPKRLPGRTVGMLGIEHADRRLVIADRPVTPITEMAKSSRQSLRDTPTIAPGHLRT